ncbi:MAG TPA: chloride channel protein [Holophagaceae bacterium]|nr:chloride channel protein [Holophagaceae bacterium]
MGEGVQEELYAGAARAVRQLLPSRRVRLRLLAHSRRIVVGILPLGVLVGLAMTLILLGLEHHLAPTLDRLAERLSVPMLLPFAALALTTLWLVGMKVGEVSLFEDLHLAKHSPFQAFPFRRSLWKVIGCGLTIGLGGSTGMEGPAKWLGASLGVQWHRFLHWMAMRFRPLRRLKTQPMAMVSAGAAAAVAVVFRAPLSGALFAVEHDGRVVHEELIPSVVAGAAAFMVWVAFAGMHPLIPMSQNYTLTARELMWALPVGVLCGIAASLFLLLRRILTHRLAAIPLAWRGLAGGAGLALLALPGHFLFHDLQITQRGGLELILHVLGGDTPPRAALLFCALKIFATALTLAAGGVGGMWICTVAMGASLGAALAAWMMPHYPGLIIMLAGAAFAGSVHEVLLVPVVFLAETTGQPALVVPGLLAATVALLVKRESN